MNMSVKQKDDLVSLLNGNYKQVCTDSQLLEFFEEYETSKETLGIIFLDHIATENRKRCLKFFFKV